LADGPTEYVEPEDWKDSDLYSDRLVEVFDSTNNTGNYLVMVRQGTTDELHYFDLLGMVEDGELVYLVSCVDTSWSEVWRGEFPHGLIDMTRPYARQGHYSNLPQPKED
jgi:hypothetical protein